ncbi:MAG TPA: hypothetical protein VG188_05310 [Solirubrobacteraceae bacterium]|jgi:hypothetical protein|nr:hypothetical protein [Solirubrobacteraceae bacterium]
MHAQLLGVRTHPCRGHSEQRRERGSVHETERPRGLTLTLVAESRRQPFVQVFLKARGEPFDNLGGDHVEDRVRLFSASE